MSEPFVGQIIAVGFNFAPVGWALCNGQTLSIAENEVLYTLIGTTYGGNGTTNFQLPNLCGRVALGQGHSAGTSNYVLGQSAGSESVTLITNQMPAHTHQMQAGAGSDSNSPSNAFLGTVPGTLAQMYDPAPAPATNVNLAPTSTTVVGSSLPHENRQSLLTVNYIIALNGIFPPQS